MNQPCEALTVVTASDRRFEPWVKRLSASVEYFGYNLIVYDIGNLGFGEKLGHSVLREQFCSSGRYPANYPMWAMRACHKPEVILTALSQSKCSFIIYLDADCLIRGRLDEVIGDYHIGVTVRRPAELSSAPLDQQPFMGQINAGVLFLRPAEPTLNFVRAWQCEVESHGADDQKALNEILNPGNSEWSPGTTKNVGPLRVKAFSTDNYNFYYFKEHIPDSAKILHFKGRRRQETFQKYSETL